MYPDFEQWVQEQSYVFLFGGRFSTQHYDWNKVKLIGKKINIKWRIML